MCALVLGCAVAWQVHEARLGAYRQMIARHAFTVTSKVTTACHDHGRINYEFVVGGRNYSGDTRDPEGDCEHSHLLRGFPVYFDPEDPSVNSDLKPRAAYSARRGALIAWLYFDLAAVVILGMSMASDRLASRNRP
jgi:hypothetical protein